MEYEIISKMFSGESPESVFEIGCASGRLMEQLQCTKGGMDISRVGIAEARQLYPKDEANFHHWNLLEPWPIEDNSFDIVFSVGVLMYIFDPATVMKEMFRVAKNKVILAEYHHPELDKYGVLIKPFTDAEGKIHTGIIRNYLDILREIRVKTEVQVIDSGANKTILKCTK